MTTNNCSSDFSVGDKVVQLRYDEKTKEHSDFGLQTEVLDIQHAQLQGTLKSVCGSLKLKKIGWVPANLVRLIHSDSVDD